jgi:hypothetical protein
MALFAVFDQRPVWIRNIRQVRIVLACITGDDGPSCRGPKDVQKSDSPTESLRNLGSICCITGTGNVRLILPFIDISMSKNHGSAFAPPPREDVTPGSEEDAYLSLALNSVAVSAGVLSMMSQ